MTCEQHLAPIIYKIIMSNLFFVNELLFITEIFKLKTNLYVTKMSIIYISYSNIENVNVYLVVMIVTLAGAETAWWG